MGDLLGRFDDVRNRNRHFVDLNSPTFYCTDLHPKLKLFFFILAINIT